MARRPNNDQRRRQIVNALHALLGERGYDGASIQVIAQRAELTPGLLHYHFANKEQILLAVVEDLSAALLARLDRRLDSGDAQDAWTSLDAWIDAHLALGDDADPASVAAWVTIGAEALRKPTVQQAYESAVRLDLARGEELVAGVLVASGQPPSPAHMHAVALLAAIEGCYRLAAAAPSVAPPGFAAPTVRAMARGLLRGHP